MQTNKRLIEKKRPTGHTTQKELSTIDLPEKAAFVNEIGDSAMEERQIVWQAPKGGGSVSFFAAFMLNQSVDGVESFNRHC